MDEEKKTMCIFMLKKCGFFNSLIHSACDTRTDYVEVFFFSVTLQLVVSVLSNSQLIGNTTMHF